MQITVLESVKGKFGPQLKDAEGFLNFGKFYQGDKAFDPGTVLEVDLFKTGKGNRYINSAKVIPTVAGAAVETPAKVETKAEPKTKKGKAMAFGRELSDYEMTKDVRIGVAGVVQAVVGSEWYAQQAALTDLSNKDSVKALREFALEEVNYWLDVIKSKSEAK